MALRGFHVVLINIFSFSCYKSSRRGIQPMFNYPYLSKIYTLFFIGSPVVQEGDFTPCWRGNRVTQGIKMGYFMALRGFHVVLINIFSFSCFKSSRRGVQPMFNYRFLSKIYTLFFIGSPVVREGDFTPCWRGNRVTQGIKMGYFF